MRGCLRALLLLAGGLMMTPGTASATWLQANSRHFTIFSEGSEAKLRNFARKLEQFDYLLRTLTGVADTPAGSPVRVYLLSDSGKVIKLARKSNAGGFYQPSDRFAYAVLSRYDGGDGFDLGAEEILFHEYSHHFMLHYFPAAYPAWYVEGFAEFFSVIKFSKDDSIIFGNIPPYRIPGLLLGSPYPLNKLLARNTEGLGLSDGDRYYGTAWLLTHYFQYNVERRQELNRYLQDIAKGVPDIKLDSYFTGGVDGLQKNLHAYMKRGLSATRLRFKALSVGEIAISSMDPAQGVLIEVELRLMCQPKTDEYPEIIASIRKTAAMFPASAHALALLADAEWMAGQKDAALADADRAISLDPALSRAYSTRAAVLLERADASDADADWRAALVAISTANRLDTEDPVPLMLYYRYHALKGGRLPELGLNGLAKAFSLLPQSPEYRTTYAYALAARGEYAAASKLLNPLAYSPHASQMRDRALELKAEYDAAASKKALPAKTVSASAP